MEDQLSSLAITHLLQHTLRSLCHENSQWVYAVFWRILPRNYPPPKWDCQGGIYDRSRGNRRNWILVWEDGFCNFAASATEMMNSGDCPSSSVYGNCEYQHFQGLQPELFFKMSHEIYNYGEGLIGKVAADHSHKFIQKEPNDQEINFLSAWHNSADSFPRTWEAQFQSGIKTIALIAVREGVIQLGAVNKVVEDLSYVVLLRKKFGYIESIPGVLLPHPSSVAYPYGMTSEAWHFHAPPLPPPEFYQQQQSDMKIAPSMSSLEALLSKLPSVVPETTSSPPMSAAAPLHYLAAASSHGHKSMGKRSKEEDEYEDEDRQKQENDFGESSSSMSSFHHHHFAYHKDLNHGYGVN